MKKAFTLAEVLITLVIIGVIAALTIPALLNDTNKQEYRTATKKAYSVLSQAVAQHYALTGENMNDLFIGKCDEDMTCIYNNFISKRMNVVSSMSPASSDAYTAGAGVDTELTVYTADGIAYSFAPSGLISVDLNGDKKPNQKTESINNLKDGGYYFFIDTYDTQKSKIEPTGAAKPVITDDKDDSNWDPDNPCGDLFNPSSWC
ncbi:MAG: type II secretion system protein [Candidatus Gastranaerophilales bacterium]|nr:type II secretion system protein [Candidatus Gastranaerophilales bacterium]